jgi:hypothetical protein
MVPVKNLEGDVSITVPEGNKILIDLFTSGYLQYKNYLRINNKFLINNI